MQVSKLFLDSLTEKAKQSPRLRANFDMRTSPEDSSQRMFNALEPGTVVPIHRHMKTTETVCLIRGCVRQNYYDEHGLLIESIVVESGENCPFYFVPVGVWHNTECLCSGTIIFESKDGKYEPMKSCDIFEK